MNRSRVGLCVIGGILVVGHLCGCFGSRGEPEVFMEKTPEGLWNVEVRRMNLEIFIREWAAKEGVVFSHISPEIRGHKVNASLRDVYFQEALDVLLEYRGFVLYDREAPPKIITKEAYDNLPPVTRSYAISSPHTEYALDLVVGKLKEEGLHANADHAAAEITFTGTWEEHDRVEVVAKHLGAAEPLPTFPDVRWPDALPDSLVRERPESAPEASAAPHVSETIEIRHVSAKDLEAKLKDLDCLLPAESATFLYTENTLLLCAREENQAHILEIIAFLDDPIWHVDDKK